MFTLMHLGHDHATQPHTAADYMLMAGLAVVSAAFIAGGIWAFKTIQKQTENKYAKQKID